MSPPPNAVKPAAHEQADADDTVEDDHQRGVDRVARQMGLLGSADDHHGQDERGLDDRHGEREHERAEGLSDPVGDDLGVMHRRDDGAHEGCGGQHGDDDADARDEGNDEHHDGDDRDCPRPRRHASF